ncbi:hypothetical protein [Streptomyces sp. TRM49041]|uniref:hypothetical protein n=1 Tax=Streptomyces sp. TRM49041 TaxID=2603216 RepID=UPI0016568AFC|nr:hypothetical protein [Streptomyces sp. TRM49041]
MQGRAWGASSKAGADDVREFPTLASAALMHQRGTTVTVHGPPPYSPPSYAPEPN